MIRQKEYRVVVTGAGPWKEHEKNPTQDVKAALPDRIERKGRTPIRIIKFATDFRNITTDMDIIPKLWSGDKRVYDPDCEEGERIYIDAMVHLGKNLSEFWQIEKRARRDGYDWVGDDGVPLPKHNGEKGERWEGLPEVLEPMFDVDKIVKQCNQDLPDIPVRTNTDAGLLYCEFIFYTSLATLYKLKEKAGAQFVHHAGKKTSKKDIEDGVRVVESVMCSMVDHIEKEESEA